jgi:Helicase associated domain
MCRPADPILGKRYQELAQFKAERGHCNAPKATSLGVWCCSQRQRKKRLNQDQIERLDAIGFCWDTKEANFQRKLQDFREFYEKNGHWRIPRSTRLGAQAKKVKSPFKNGRLAPEKAKQLEEIGFPLGSEIPTTIKSVLPIREAKAA